MLRPMLITGFRGLERGMAGWSPPTRTDFQRAHQPTPLHNHVITWQRMPCLASASRRAFRSKGCFSGCSPGKSPNRNRQTTSFPRPPKPRRHQVIPWRRSCRRWKFGHTVVTSTSRRTDNLSSVGHRYILEVGTQEVGISSMLMDCRARCLAFIGT